jgi:hypothetical protein
MAEPLAIDCADRINFRQLAGAALFDLHIGARNIDANVAIAVCIAIIAVQDAITVLLDIHVDATATYIDVDIALAARGGFAGVDRHVGQHRSGEGRRRQQRQG